MKRSAVFLLVLGVLLAFTSPASGSPLTKALSVDKPAASAVTYAPQRVAPGERATKPYPSYTYYSDIGRILSQIDRTSSRVSVRIFGYSAGGRPMYLATVQNPWASKAARQRWLKFISLQTTDPAAAAAMLKKGGDLRAPVFINCSIHGGETTGVDAGLMLLRKLAYSNDPTTLKILKNNVVMIDVVQNPDGRVLDRRQNDNGFDLNRDWVTQSQPEVQAVAGQIVKWHPTMFLDLHGYYDPMVIDPTTNPHDPNYEWDLSIKWALPAALSIEKAIEDNTPVEVDIPYRDWINPDTGKSEGFEDYSPYYTPQFAMFYGLVGSTMETASKSEDGVDAHYYGIYQGAKYTAEHRVGMLRDQINRFLRADKGQSQPVTADVPEPITYPGAYVIPVGDGQQDMLQADRAVRHLVRNGIEVYKAGAEIVDGASTYPAGSYIVPLKQPLRGIANAMLWYGQDISSQVKEMYDACAWQLPEAWGFSRVALDKAPSVPMVRVRSANDVSGAMVSTEPGSDYVLRNSTNAAVSAVNRLVKNGVKVDRVVGGATEAAPLGSYVVHAANARVLAAVEDAAKVLRVTFETADVSGATLEPLYDQEWNGGTLERFKVGVYYDGPTCFALKQMGFDAEVIDSDADLGAYDVLVVDDTSGLDLAAVAQWVDDGGAYIANGPYGFIPGLLPVTGEGGVDWDFYWANNTLGRTVYDEDSLVAAGLGSSGYTFAFPITWFSFAPDAPVAVDASYAADYFQAGFWREPDPTGWVKSDAGGKPIVVHGFVGDGRVTYIGPLPAFRAGTFATFRLLANAVFTASYNELSK